MQVSPCYVVLLFPFSLNPAEPVCIPQPDGVAFVDSVSVVSGLGLSYLLLPVSYRLYSGLGYLSLTALISEARSSGKIPA